MDSNRLPSSDYDTGAWQQCRHRWVTLCTLMGLFFILLLSCAGPTSTGGTTPQASITPGNQASIIPGNPTPTAPALTQQYEFTEQDSGRMLIYTVTSRFGIILNSQKYPKENLLVSCQPQGTLGSISNLPSVAPPLYAVRYEGVEPGICAIRNGSFLLMVRIVELTQ